MATLPANEIDIIREYGPHLSSMAGLSLSTSVEPERLVALANLLLFALPVLSRLNSGFSTPVLTRAVKFRAASPPVYLNENSPIG